MALEHGGRRFLGMTWTNLFLLAIILFQLLSHQSSTMFSIQVAYKDRNEDINPSITNNNNEPSNNRLYGHIHIAKTAGSVINLKLIGQYERICGNEGYSYDALRNKEHGTDSHSMSYPNYSRSFVPWMIVREIGFEDCDFVTLEEEWKVWPKNFGSWPFPVELHLPCREPIDHLMSQCNYRGLSLDCNANDKQLEEQIKACMVAEGRFHKDLVYRFPVKCYDAKNVHGYVEYMGNVLQKRRIVSQDKHESHVSSQQRSKQKECIWDDQQLQKRAIDYLVRNYDYYDFCMNRCMGTHDELQLPVGAPP